MTREITIIAALSNNNVIEGNDLLWYLKKNLMRVTKKESPIIMGRKTYELIGKSLKREKIIVLSRNRINMAGNRIFRNSLENVLNSEELSNQRLYVSGGYETYKQTIDLADRIELIRVNRFVNGNIFFPKIKSDEWELVHNKNDSDYSYSYCTFKRKE